MTATVRHPYLGHLIVCAELEGQQHESKHAWPHFWVGECWCCGYPMLGCIDCSEWISCCPCGYCHAIECAALP